jgi:ABC-2 type transport system ATP-binding protein/lipopolysaccharide transport system ATP-binding protein
MSSSPPDRIRLQGVSKRYQLGVKATTAREALNQRMHRVVRRGAVDRSELWSLRDVSFSVAEGEALGIVGPNGAGKSTILKILTGITVPTSGAVVTRGRVAALLEVGTGFHPELTGRENVYLNGAILGMSRRDIRLRFDAIVDFAGIERFLDTPVKRYSSGMYLRLAFAVAAHLEPDILVVDEILAVGDAEFQRKCLSRMQEVERQGRTVVFVSHDLDTLSKLCTRSLWLEAGRIRDSGATGDDVRQYLAAHSTSPGQTVTAVSAGPVTLENVRVLPLHSGPPAPLFRDDGLAIEIDFELCEITIGFDVAVFITNSRGTRIVDEALSDEVRPRLTPGTHRLRLQVPPVLNVGDYTVGVWFGTSYQEILEVPTAFTFTLEGSDRGRPDRALVLRLPMSVTSLKT